MVAVVAPNLVHSKVYLSSSSFDEISPKKKYAVLQPRFSFLSFFKWAYFAMYVILKSFALADEFIYRSMTYLSRFAVNDFPYICYSRTVLIRRKQDSSHVYRIDAVPRY